MVFPLELYGLLIILIYIVFAFLFLTGKLSLLLGLVMLSAIVGLVGGGAPLDVAMALGKGSYGFASVMAAIMVGGWLAMYLVKSGIAEDFVRRAIELAGESRVAICVVSYFAVAFLFTILYGLGTTMMLGQMVIPVLLATGISPAVAGTVFALAASGGYYWNPTMFSFWMALTGFDIWHFFPFVPIVTTIFYIACMALIYFKVHRGRRTLSDGGKPEPSLMTAPPHKRVRVYALITPAIPLIAAYVFKLDIVASFLVGIVYVYFATLESLKPAELKAKLSLLTQSFSDGIASMSFLLALTMGTGMLREVCNIPVVVRNVLPFFAAIYPKTVWLLIPFFAVMGPLILFRGPFNKVGLGAGVIPLLMGWGYYTPTQIFAPFYAMYSLGELDPTYSDRIWIAGFSGMKNSTEILKTGFIYIYVGYIASLIVAVGMFYT